MKEGFCAGIGVVGGFIASLFGGWDAALITLVIFMGIDYFTGLIVAGCSIIPTRQKTAVLKALPGGRGFAERALPF